MVALPNEAVPSAISALSISDANAHPMKHVLCKRVGARIHFGFTVVLTLIVTILVLDPADPVIQTFFKVLTDLIQ